MVLEYTFKHTTPRAALVFKIALWFVFGVLVGETHGPFSVVGIYFLDKTVKVGDTLGDRAFT